MMRIAFQKRGGVAFIPGLQRKRSLSADELTTQQRKKLDKLFEASHFFDMPATLEAPAARAGAADMRTYVLEVDEGGRSHQVEWQEGAAPEELQALFDGIERMAV